jgi:hypothetical protein
MRVENTLRIGSGSQQTGTKTGKAQSATATADDFGAIYSDKVKKLWDDFQKTGLTAADQALKDAGGEDVLKLKQELEKEAKQQKSSNALNTETIKKIMPDGSVLTITMKNGKVADQYRKQPHMIAATDILHPENTDQKIASSTRETTKRVARCNVFDD